MKLSEFMKNVYADIHLCLALPILTIWGLNMNPVLQGKPEADGEIGG